MFGAAGALERHVGKRRKGAWRRSGGAAAAANLARGEGRPQALLGSCGWDRNVAPAHPPGYVSYVAYVRYVSYRAASYRIHFRVLACV